MYKLVDIEELNRRSHLIETAVCCIVVMEIILKILFKCHRFACLSHFNSFILSNKN